MHIYDLDCPICMNSFKFEHIRSLPCGHTYCSSCVEKIIDDFPTCPECRQEFELEDVRRLFITPSTTNNRSGSQPVSPGRDLAAEEEGYIKHAKHIAKRLRKMDANSSAQSVKIAADVIGDVATVQCREAQEIIWTAVREFWLRLVTDFERLEICKDIREKISNFEQRITVFEEMCPRLQLEVENERDRVQQYMVKLDDKTREIERLTMVLRDAEDEKERERERQHVLVARLRASEIKHRAQIKQLKKDLKSREANIATSRSQLEEESLIIDPGVEYDETRSHRLHVYNDGSPRSKGHRLSPEASSPAVGFDLPLPADENWPSKNVPSPHELQAHLGMGQSHQAAPPESHLRQPSPQRPKFGSDWNLSRQRQRRKPTAMSSSGALPFPLDSEGRPKGLLKYGSRVRMKAR